MPPLFLPEIELYAEKDPNLYEILLRLAGSQAQNPVLSGNTDPTGVLAASPNSLYIQTDPTGKANGIFVNADGTSAGWQALSKVLDPSIPAKTNTVSGAMSPIAQQFLTKGKLILGPNSAQFDAQGRIKNSFFANPVDVASTTLTQPITQNGTTTQILVAAATWQFGEFTLSYNSGSVDPGAYGTYNIYVDDPNYVGGALPYGFSTLGTGATVAKRGRLRLGQITTSAAGGATGGGGGRDGTTCFSPGAFILTQRGAVRIAEVRLGDLVLTGAKNWRRVIGLTTRAYHGEMVPLEGDECVTPGHMFYHEGLWVPKGTLSPKRVLYAGPIHNLHVQAEEDLDHSYTLADGEIAHNALTA